MEVKKRPNVATLTGILTGVVFFAIAYFGMQKLLSGNQNFEEATKAAAVEINKQTPLRIDDETSLDSVAARPGNVFLYNYSLVHMEMASTDIEGLKSNLEPGIIENVKKEPNLKIFRDNEATLQYNYYDMLGEFMFTITVAPEQYQHIL